MTLPYQIGTLGQDGGRVHAVMLHGHDGSDATNAMDCNGGGPQKQTKYKMCQRCSSGIRSGRAGDMGRWVSVQSGPKLGRSGVRHGGLGACQRGFYVLGQTKLLTRRGPPPHPTPRPNLSVLSPPFISPRSISSPPRRVVAGTTMSSQSHQEVGVACDLFFDFGIYDLTFTFRLEGRRRDNRVYTTHTLRKVCGGPGDGGPVSAAAATADRSQLRGSLAGTSLHLVLDAGFFTVVFHQCCFLVFQPTTFTFGVSKPNFP